jgi:hypothetical protein
MRFLVIGFLLTACSTLQEPTPTAKAHRPVRTNCTKQDALKSWDPLLDTFIEDFFQDARHFGSTCFRARSVQFGTQESMPKAEDGVIIGYCTDRGEIVLSEQVWKQYGLLFNKALLYHELGHCILQLDHAPEGTLNLMAPRMLVDYELAEHWAELKLKLFTGSLSLNEGDSDVVFDRHFLPGLR